MFATSFSFAILAPYATRALAPCKLSISLPSNARELSAPLSLVPLLCQRLLQALEPSPTAHAYTRPQYNTIPPGKIPKQKQV